MHNKQKKDTVHENSFTVFFSLVRLRNGIKETHKVMIWGRISRESVGAGGGGEVRVKSVVHFAFDCQI